MSGGENAPTTKRLAGMKSISAAIIVLAAAVCYGSGAISTDPEYSLAASWVGIVVGGIGLLGWIVTLAERHREP
jgi:drug/metabolite transporter (DMT)-like permease